MTDQSPALRCQHLIVTIYGLYAREQGAALPVSSLIRMLGELGIEAAGVRSSVSRLKRRGVLESRREDHVARYGIAYDGQQIFDEGDARIFSRRRARLDEEWLLVVFSIPETERAKRHTLRSELTRLGFGSVTSGVWIAPINVYEQTKRQIERLRLGGYIDFFGAEHLSPDGMRAKVAQWWDLDGLDALYEGFIVRYQDVLVRWEALSTGAVADEVNRDAFIDYIPMFTEWRRLPYLDPGLPLELLPEGWNGVVAERLFVALHQLLGPLAQQYVDGVIHPAMPTTL